MVPTPSVDVRRAANRFRTRTDWLDSRHSFSFGPHYDPDDTHFGLLMVSNDDVVRAGGGFDTHPHRDMEIVTWVLEGALMHQDSTGRTGLIHPGLAQRMSAGSGILHSEANAAGRAGGPRPDPAAGESADVHFVQMWVVPDSTGVAPGYEQLDVTPELERGGLVVVASGGSRHAEDRAVALHQEHAALHVGRLRAGAHAALPTSPLAHVFVAAGAVELEGSGPLRTGDAARVTGSEGQRVTAGPDGAEVLVWEMHATLG